MNPNSERERQRPVIDCALQGRLADVSLFDLCQFLMLNRKTGTLAARKGGKSAFLTFHEGQLLNAIDETLREGEAVILAAVQWCEGTFTFDAGPVPLDRRIESSTENVLLEAARQLDEMMAGDLLEREDGEDGPTSHVDHFHETQRRSAELSEAFHQAVSDENEASLGAAWKETIIRALVENRAERVIVGPGSGIHVVGGGTAAPIEVPSFGEVERWLSTIADPGHSWDPRRGDAYGAWGAGPDGIRLWVTRHSSVEGPWFTVSHPPKQFPNWEGMGFGDELATRLRGVGPGPLVLASPEAHVLHAAIAAWIARRAAEAPEVVWVVEADPSYDWRELPGRVRTIGEADLSESGGLSALCDRTQPSLVVLRQPEREDVLLSAWHSTALGRQVVVGMLAAGPGEALSAISSLLRPLEAAGAAASPSIEGAAIWWVRPGADERPYPTVSEVLEPPSSARAA